VVSRDGVETFEAVSGKALVIPEQESREQEKVGLIYIPESARVKPPKKDRGILAFAGEPIKGQPALGVLPGSRVFFPEFCAHENEIMGKKYYVMQQEYILAYEEVV